MTTREELIDGFRMMIREGLRTTARFGPEDWAYRVHDEDGGWTTKQVYCHLASTADIVPGLVGAMSQAPEGQNVAGGIDINAFNAQGIARRESMDPKDLMSDFEASHNKLIDFIEQMPEDQLQQNRRFGAIEGPVIEIMQTTLVLHGLSHIYHAQNRPLN